MGDLSVGREEDVLALLVPAEAALAEGDLAARMDNLSSSLLGREIGLGILDFPDLLDLPLSLLTSLPGVVAPVLGNQDEP